MATRAAENLAVGPMIPRPFRVTHRVRETYDTWTLELAPVAGESARAAPGQFTMLYAFGIGEVPISISGQRDGLLVHTVRAVGAVTEAICAALEGSVLGVRGPLGNSWPIDAAAGGDAIVIAGGIGMAPLRPVLEDVARRRADFGRVALLYGARTPRDLLYRRDLERWVSSFDIAVDVTVDAAEADWHGKVGVVPKLIASADLDAGSTTAFVVGPEVMMRFAADALLERGIAADRIHVSLERNMRCGIGHCGHCQLGPTLICRDGPVYRWADVERLLAVREL